MEDVDQLTPYIFFFLSLTSRQRQINFSFLSSLFTQATLTLSFHRRLFHFNRLILGLFCFWLRLGFFFHASTSFCLKLRDFSKMVFWIFYSNYGWFVFVFFFQELKTEEREARKAKSGERNYWFWFFIFRVSLN
jgi:hypothetical protein